MITLLFLELLQKISVAICGLNRVKLILMAQGGVEQAAESLATQSNDG